MMSELFIVFTVSLIVSRYGPPAFTGPQSGPQHINVWHGGPTREFLLRDVPKRCLRRDVC